MHRVGSDGIAVDQVLRTISQRRTLPVSSQSEGGSCRQALRQRRVEGDDSLLLYCTIAISMHSVEKGQCSPVTRTNTHYRVRGDPWGGTWRSSHVCKAIRSMSYPNQVDQDPSGKSRSEREGRSQKWHFACHGPTRRNCLLLHIPRWQQLSKGSTAPAPDKIPLSTAALAIFCCFSLLNVCNRHHRC